MPPTQSAALQEATAELEKAPSAIRSTAIALYELLLAEHDKANVLVWPKQRIISFGHGPKKMSQHYAYIGMQAKHVNLGFYVGASLPDPSGLLEGTGKNLRHVKLQSPLGVQSPALVALLRAAIQERSGYAQAAA